MRWNNLTQNESLKLYILCKITAQNCYRVHGSQIKQSCNVFIWSNDLFILPKSRNLCWVQTFLLVLQMPESDIFVLFCFVFYFKVLKTSLISFCIRLFYSFAYLNKAESDVLFSQWLMLSIEGTAWNCCNSLE